MRLQPIENLSKTYSGDPHLGQTKLNGLLLLTIHGVLAFPEISNHYRRKTESSEKQKKTEPSSFIFFNLHTIQTTKK